MTTRDIAIWSISAGAFVVYLVFQFWLWRVRDKKRVHTVERERKQWRPDQVIHEDPNAREVIARAINSRRPVIGNIDKDGNLHIEEL